MPPKPGRGGRRRRPLSTARRRASLSRNLHPLVRRILAAATAGVAMLALLRAEGRRRPPILVGAVPSSTAFLPSSQLARRTPTAAGGRRRSLVVAAPDHRGGRWATRPLPAESPSDPRSARCRRASEGSLLSISAGADFGEPSSSSSLVALEAHLSDLLHAEKIRNGECAALVGLIRRLDVGDDGAERCRPLLDEAVRAYSRQSWRRSVSGLSPCDDPAGAVLEWCRRNGGAGEEEADLLERLAAAPSSSSVSSSGAKDVAARSEGEIEDKEEDEIIHEEEVGIYGSLESKATVSGVVSQYGGGVAAERTTTGSASSSAASRPPEGSGRPDVGTYSTATVGAERPVRNGDGTPPRQREAQLRHDDAAVDYSVAARAEKEEEKPPPPAGGGVRNGEKVRSSEEKRERRSREEDPTDRAASSPRAAKDVAAAATVDLATAERCLSLLRQLEEPLTSIKGVGPKTSDALRDGLGLTTVRSLLWHFPHSFVDRTRVYDDASLAVAGASEAGGVATLVVTVKSVMRFPKVLRVECIDDAGNDVALVHFHGASGRGRGAAISAEKAAGGTGSRRIVSGKIRPAAAGGWKNGGDGEGEGRGGGGYEILGPDLVKPEEDLAEVAGIEPVYKLTNGVNNKKMTKAVDAALQLGAELLRSAPGESLSVEALEGMGWPSLADALLQSHRPADSAAAEGAGPTSPARRRLAFEELCVQQAQLALTRWQYKNPQHRGGGGDDEPAVLNASADAEEEESPPSLPSYGSWRDSPLVSSAVAALPFDLTLSQEACLSETWEDSIAAVGDTGRASRMARLLQGDVGSGKTVVAYLLGLGCVESSDGGSNVVALLAPTALLAKQHYETFVEFADALTQSGHLSSQSRIQKFRVEMLTGAVTGRKREDVLRRLERCGDDEAIFLVGTHALLTPDVASRLGDLRGTAARQRRGGGAGGLALAVADEEQRFGVRQRDVLAGVSRHALYMSATPIPRTMVLTGGTAMSSSGSDFASNIRTGTLDVSFLKGKPSSARKAKTSVVDIKRAREVAEGLAGQIAGGDKVFWILPRIGDYEDDDENASSEEDSIQSQVHSVLSRHEALSALLGDGRVGMIHGKMPISEREEELERFASPDSGPRVLVGTTVLEVGIDIPDVSILVVENAERFGLSQLHQLRGRIGRAGSSAERETDCHCILLTDVFDDDERSETSSTAMSRLDILRDSDDGAEIAMRDLALRGPGEVLGLRQSGLRNGYTVDLAAHFGMIGAASVLGRSFVEENVSLVGLIDNGGPEADIQFGGGGPPDEFDPMKHITRSAAPGRSPPKPFFGDAGSSSPGGLALRVYLSFFGKWVSSVDECGTGHSLAALKQVLGAGGGDDFTAEEEAIERAFSSLANSFSEDAFNYDDALLADTAPTLDPLAKANGAAVFESYQRGPVEGERSATETVRRSAATASCRDEEQLLLLLDVETTGLSKSSHITQIAAKFLGDDEVFSRYVLPPEKLSDKIEELTGITNDFLRFGGVDPATGDILEGPAPDFACAYGHFCDFVRRKAERKPVCLVAHNAAFDVRMLNGEMKRLLAKSARGNEVGGVVPDFSADTGIVSSLDTLRLFKNERLWSSQLGLSAPPSFGLGKVYHHILDKGINNQHNAVGDVNALEEILLSLSAVDWRDLAEQTKKPYMPPPV